MINRQTPPHFFNLGPKPTIKDCRLVGTWVANWGKKTWGPELSDWMAWPAHIMFRTCIMRRIHQLTPIPHAPCMNEGATFLDFFQQNIVWDPARWGNWPHVDFTTAYPSNYGPKNFTNGLRSVTSVFHAAIARGDEFPCENRMSMLAACWLLLAGQDGVLSTDEATGTIPWRPNDRNLSPALFASQEMGWPGMIPNGSFFGPFPINFKTDWKPADFWVVDDIRLHGIGTGPAKFMRQKWYRLMSTILTDLWWVGARSSEVKNADFSGL